MTTEFNLSEKGKKDPYDKDCLIFLDNDVKEFIRLLKEIIPECLDNPTTYEQEVLKKINELAGEKLP